jgi:hypothetical protein
MKKVINGAGTAMLMEDFDIEATDALTNAK